MITNRKFMEGIAYLSTVFEQIKPNAVDVYKKYLEDLTDQEYSEAINLCIQEKKWKDFPTIADIRFYAGKDTETMARNAIEKFKKAARPNWDIYSISFTDKTLNAVVSGYGNWCEICNWGDTEWSIAYKRLIELYCAYKRSGRYEDKIVGLDEKRGIKYRLYTIGEIGQEIKKSELLIPEKKGALLKLEDHKSIIKQIIDNCQEMENEDESV